MSTIGIIIGSDPFDVKQTAEDPSSTLRISALAASWAAAHGHTVLTMGDGPALLAVGTAVIGLQQERVLEGGERRRSPMRVLALLSSENADNDRSLAFRRSGAEQRGEPGDASETLGQEQTFGDLSLLIDIGVMDLVGDSQLLLQPQSPEAAAENLSRQLFEEQPEAILAIGQVPPALNIRIREYINETQSRFASALGSFEGAERLIGAEQIPRLNNRRLRFRESMGPFDEVHEDVYDTADSEFIHAADQATREAETTFRIYQWLISSLK